MILASRPGLTYIGADGSEVTPTIRLLGAPAENDNLAAQQVRLEQGDHKRRFDIICYVNGLPSTNRAGPSPTPACQTRPHNPKRRYARTNYAPAPTHHA